MLKKALVFGAFFYAFIIPSVHAEPVSVPVCAPQRIDENALVDYVYDGDTLRLKDGRKLRLIGIDTPEVFSKKRPIAPAVKAAGEGAREALKKQLEAAGQRIGLAYGRQRHDRYGRSLAHVFLADGTNLQAWLIAQGHAIAFTTPPNDRMSHCYRQQESLARKKRLGIWQLPQYQLKSVHQLPPDSQGFHRLQGRVRELRQGQRRVILMLGDRVEVSIYQPDLRNFSAHMLKTLPGREVRLRGWLRKKKNSENAAKKTVFEMRLRHPDAMVNLEN